MNTILLIATLLGCSAKEEPRQFARSESSSDCESVYDKFCQICDDNDVEEYADCIEELSIDFPCEASKQTGDSFERCMYDLEDYTCWGPLPEACVGVLEF